MHVLVQLLYSISCFGLNLLMQAVWEIVIQRRLLADLATYKNLYR